jgi:ABC-type amino acid transport substrate-binding protein
LTSWQLLCAASLLGVSALGPALSAANPGNRLTVGVPAGLPGYEMLEGNRLKINDPFKKSITECIAGRLNATFVWVAYPTKRILQLLQAREIDMVYPMGFTEERAAAMAQSHLTWQNPDVLVSMRPVAMSDKNMRIAARLGSPQQTDYVSDGYSHIAATYAYEDLAKLLARGLVDVVIVPRSVYNEQRADWPSKVMVSAGKPRSSGFYLNKDDPKGLLKPLNESIARCRDSDASK